MDYGITGEYVKKKAASTFETAFLKTQFYQKLLKQVQGGILLIILRNTKRRNI